MGLVPKGLNFALRWFELVGIYDKFRVIHGESLNGVQFVFLCRFWA